MQKVHKGCFKRRSIIRQLALATILGKIDPPIFLTMHSTKNSQRQKPLGIYYYRRT
jgi:hypothetical protein